MFKFKLYAINSEQKKFIYQYCNETIKKINLNTVVHYNDNGGYSCSWDVIYITFFSEYFNFDYDYYCISIVIVIDFKERFG